MKTTEFVPVHFKDFLKPKEYEYIYNKINSVWDNNLKNNNPKYTDFVVHERGFAHYMFSEDETDKDFFIAFSKEINRVLGFEVSPSHGFFARYSKEHGTQPSLYPHIDKNGDKIHTFSISLQLDSTLDWDLYIQDTKFEMEKNDIVVFTGSHHTHWRPFREFGENDYFDIFVAHFVIHGQEEPLAKGHSDMAEKRMIEYFNKYEDKIFGKV